MGDLEKLFTCWDQWGWHRVTVYGDLKEPVYALGEAYAFGVVWSFFLKGLGVLVLRHQRHDQEYKTPLNFRIGGRELPVGLILATSVLFLTAVANLFSKRVATKSASTPRRSLLQI